MPPAYRSLKAARYPLARTRLYYSIFTGAVFAILLYLASVGLGWFTLIRGFFLPLGAVEGLLVGLYEARVVTRELSKKTETVVWRTLPISALGALPVLLMIIMYGTSEFVPIAAYFVFPFIPAYYASSGWRYRRFEKDRRVQIFMFVYGFWFWTEPLDTGPRFNQFIAYAVSKDYSGILSQAGYSDKLIAFLKERPKIERSTRDSLFKLLDFLRRYRRRALAFTWTFILSMIGLIIYFFALAATNAFGFMKVQGGVIVEGQTISLVLGIVPMVLVFGGVATAGVIMRRAYRKRISTLLTSLNLNKLSELKTDQPQNPGRN